MKTSIWVQFPEHGRLVSDFAKEVVRALRTSGKNKAARSPEHLVTQIEECIIPFVEREERGVTTRIPSSIPRDLAWVLWCSDIYKRGVKASGKKKGGAKK